MFVLTDERGAEAAGYAAFNPGAHVLIPVPNEMFTLTCKTPNGKRVTICFVDKAGCVDVQVHDGESFEFNGKPDHVVQNVVTFGPGNVNFDSRGNQSENPVLLTTFLLGD